MYQAPIWKRRNVLISVFTQLYETPLVKMANGVRFAIKRYGKITFALIRYGVWSLYLSRLFDWVLRRDPRYRITRPAQLRRLLESLGGTFVKFGQILAMRPDLLPPEYINELSELFDSAPVFDSRMARARIESELGGTIKELFQSFEDTPLAAASFAQVHRGVLQTGEKVVIKVQRPGLREIIDTDLRLMRFLAFTIDLSGLMRNFRVRPLIEDFVEWTYEELDYVTEATYAELMRKSSTQNRYEYIPKVFWDYTTSSVLVLEYLEGVWIVDILKALDAGDDAKIREWEANGIDLQIVASNIFDSGLHQAFEEEVFHADPHAGNLVVLEGNRIGYIDFGIIGRLGDHFRSSQWLILNSLEQGKLDRYVDGVMRLFSPPPETVDVERFQELIKKNARRWLNNFHNPKATLFERSSASILSRNMSLARQFGLSYSHVAVRYYRALLVAEMIVLQLDKNFDFQQQLRTYFTRYGFRTLIREHEPNRLFLSILRSRELISGFPETLDKLFELANREMLSIRTSVSVLKHGLAMLLKTMAIMTPLLGLVATVLRFTSPETYNRYIPIRWLWLVLGVIALTPSLAWMSRRLAIGSVQRGKYVKYN